MVGIPQNSHSNLYQDLQLKSLQIVPLESSHLPGIMELDRLCFGGWWNLAHYQWELDHPESHFLVLTIPEVSEVAEVSKISDPQVNNMVIGVGGFWQILEEAHIHLLAIHPQYQGKGLGKFLLGQLLQLAKEIGLERATLEVRESNHQALGLYQKFGFQEAGRRPNYYADTSEAGVILWLNHLEQREF
jgi:ribosomal-protein-alanine N-acetyltransferase